MTGMDQPGICPPFTLSRPAAHVAPVILTSPHSGRAYPAEFLAASHLDPTTLRRSEDSFVEELFEAAPRLGAPLLAANFPRAWCDANREEWELDPTMFSDALPGYVNVNSPRGTAGLGTIARIVGAGDQIYARKLSFAEARTRIATCWQPFHQALRRLVDETVAQFGVCLVLDCHSMPSPPGRPTGWPDVVLGDGHGTSCTPAVTAFLQAGFGRLGFAVQRNDPYAGGYITRHYGRPGAGVHVVQVELARSLYMDEERFFRTADFTPVQKRIEQLLAVILAGAGDMMDGQVLAAE